MINDELTPGTRVCSKNRGKYYHRTGTVRCRAQYTFDSRPGLEYLVDMDSGHTETFHVDDLETPTPEIEAWNAEQVRKTQEWNQHVQERNQQRAEAREQSKREKLERREQEHADKLAEQEAKRQANNEQQRRNHAAEYGRHSLNL